MWLSWIRWPWGLDPDWRTAGECSAPRRDRPLRASLRKLGGDACRKAEKCHLFIEWDSFFYWSFCKHSTSFFLILNSSFTTFFAIPGHSVSFKNWSFSVIQCHSRSHSVSFKNFLILLGRIHTHSLWSHSAAFDVILHHSECIQIWFDRWMMSECAECVQDEW